MLLSKDYLPPGIALFRSLARQFGGLMVIPRDAEDAQVESREICLRLRVTLVGGQARPAYGFGWVFGHAPSIDVTLGYRILPHGMVLRGSFAVPLEGFLRTFRHAVALVEGKTQGQLRFDVACLGLLRQGRSFLRLQFFCRVTEGVALALGEYGFARCVLRPNRHSAKENRESKVQKHPAQGVRVGLRSAVHGDLRSSELLKEGQACGQIVEWMFLLAMIAFSRRLGKHELSAASDTAKCFWQSMCESRIKARADPSPSFGMTAAVLTRGSKT